MRRGVAFIFSVVLAFGFLSCSKNKSGNESAFYGMWVRGVNTGDTLQFHQKNGKNILSMNWSFNPLLYAPVEFEYFYTDDHLSIRYPSYPGPDQNIQSFKWKKYGEEFEVQGIEFFPFMSSTQVYFSYHKLQ